jgi:hypothetical protein
VANHLFKNRKNMRTLTIFLGLIFSFSVFADDITLTQNNLTSYKSIVSERGDPAAGEGDCYNYQVVLNVKNNGDVSTLTTFIEADRCDNSTLSGLLTSLNRVKTGRIENNLVLPNFGNIS